MLEGGSSQRPSVMCEKNDDDAKLDKKKNKNGVFRAEGNNTGET